jgi:monoamine oxidase
MPAIRVVIIGAGLSGLYASCLLRQRGIDHVVIEARARIGGRIHTEDEAVDLGATWFWPDMQPQMEGLIRQLGLHAFAQHDTGDMLLDHAHDRPPLRQRPYDTAVSMRLTGGMQALTNKLADDLATDQLYLERKVIRIRLASDRVFVDTIGTGKTPSDRDAKLTFDASHVLLAGPPRVIARDVAFEPALPAKTLQRWRETATWMAPHAKYVAVYREPFWRNEGLSGMARSSIGPLAEIHDAGNSHGIAALFGFIGIPARARDLLGDVALSQHCRAQLVRLFGQRAATPASEFLKDWAKDELTATADDQIPAVHGTSSERLQDRGLWGERLLLAGSELSQAWPGYLAGALEAAERAVQELAEDLNFGRR